MHAGKDSGGKHGGREAGAFLVRPVGHDDRMLRPDVEVVQRADDFERAENAEDTIELAAGRLGIEVASNIDWQGVRIGTFAAEEHIAHRVDAHGHAGALAPGLEEVPPFAILVGERLAVVSAANARTDLRHLHQAVPETVAVDPHIAGQGHAIGLSSATSGSARGGRKFHRYGISR
jgi:hypothetical protein